MLRAVVERRLLWPGIAALLGLALLISLGNWQMQRLAWKEGLIGAIAERTHQPPVALAAVEQRAAEGGDVEYTRVSLSGSFRHDREVHLYALDDRDGPGFDILVPLGLADGSYVWVNRGYVPNGLKDAAKRRAGQPEGEVAVVGLVRQPDAHRMFIPDNDPARNIWYWRDIDALAASLGADASRVHRLIVDAEAEPANPGGWPRGGTTRLTLANRHLEYALTWYGLAATLVGVFIAFAIGRWRDPSATSAEPRQ